MPSTPPPGTPLRTAAELNQLIRALWSHPAVPLTAEQREEYGRLLDELRQVELGDVTTAA